ELPRAAGRAAARRPAGERGAARYPEREGVQGIHGARKRPVGPGHRRGHVPQPEHGRDAPVQHQAEARRGEFGGARADRHARGPAHTLVSTRSSSSALAAGSTACTVTPSPGALVIAQLPPKACTRSRIPATPKRPFCPVAAWPRPLPSSRTQTTTASAKLPARSRFTETLTRRARAWRTTFVNASCTMR